MKKIELQKDLLTAFCLLPDTVEKKTHINHIYELLQNLCTQFFSGKYNPGQYRSFVVSDPHFREIFAKSLRKKEIKPPLKLDLLLLRKFQSVINSYYGFISFADTYKLRKNIYEQHFLYLKGLFFPQNNYTSFKIMPP